MRERAFLAIFSLSCAAARCNTLRHFRLLIVYIVFIYIYTRAGNYIPQHTQPIQTTTDARANNPRNVYIIKEKNSLPIVSLLFTTAPKLFSLLTDSSGLVTGFCFVSRFFCHNCACLLYTYILNKKFYWHKKSRCWCWLRPSRNRTIGNAGVNK